MARLPPTTSSWALATAAASHPCKASGSQPELACNRVHGLGECYVALGDAAGVMGGQDHFHGLVDVAPFRVMVVLFGHQRRAGHEAEGLVEILEHEGPRDRLPASQLGPAGQPLERRFTCLRR